MTEVKVKVLIAQLCPTLQPRGLWPARLLRPWNSPNETAGVGCHLPLQGVSPTQGSNPGLLHSYKIAIFYLIYMNNNEYYIYII